MNCNLTGQWIKTLGLCRRMLVVVAVMNAVQVWGAIPEARTIRQVCMPGSNIIFNVLYNDPGAMVTSISIVDGAAHGVVSTQGISYTEYAPGFVFGLKYQADAGFKGVDHFTYRLNCATGTSNIATGYVQVREANERAGNLIVLTVVDALYPIVSNEVQRLRQDLIDDGYTSKVYQVSAGTSASNVWTYLKGEYEDPSQWLAGSILIGNVAKPSVLDDAYGLPGAHYTDLVYWNMNYFQTTSRVFNTQIWVSRMYVNQWSPMFWPQSPVEWRYGTEPDLIKRALQTNHECRKGISRLGLEAYYYNSLPDFAVDRNNILNVWPTMIERLDSSDHVITNRFFPDRKDIDEASADALLGGGDVWDENGHAGGTDFTYMDGKFTTDDLFRLIVQQRVCLISSCTSGNFGGIVNNHIYTRGGGCIWSVGATESPTWNDYSVAARGSPGFIGRLAARESWGTSYVYDPAFGDMLPRELTVFYGDLSMTAMPTPPNAVPVVTLGASTNSVVVGQSVNFRISVLDPDEGVMPHSTNVNFSHQVEWFMEGYNMGLKNPTLTRNSNDAGWTNLTYSYTKGGVYTVRAEVMDEWKARGWREITVTVNTPPAASNDTATVEIGKSVFIPVLANDGDVDGDAIVVNAVLTGPQYGTAVVAVDSVSGVSGIVYTPTNAIWSGVDVLTYQVRDARGATNSALVAVTVIGDVTSPQLESAVCLTNDLLLTFSEKVQAGTGVNGAENTANYVIGNGVTVLSAQLQADGKTVRLVTSGFSTNVNSYTVVVNNVGDLSQPCNVVAAASELPLQILYKVWNQHMRLGLSGYKPAGTGETLTNFPALVVLNEGLAGFSYAQFACTNGADLRFSTSSRRTELSCEIEKWNTNGNSYVWVQIPEWSSSNDCIWAFWGNALATNIQASTTNGTVWGNRYSGVWHMSGVSDSTVNGNNGVNIGTTNVMGSVGDGRLFNNNCISVQNSHSVSFAGSFSAEAWINVSDFTNSANSGVRTIMSRNHDNSYAFGVQSSRLQLVLNDGVGAETRSVAYAFSTGCWYHVAAVADLSSRLVRFYVNGAQAGAAQATSKSCLSQTNMSLLLGSWNGNNYEAFYGSLDELRLSDGLRSSNWISACYMNQASNGQFYNFGPVEANAIPDAAPVTTNMAVSIAENSSVDIVFSGSDADGDPLKFRIVSPPAHGLLSSGNSSRFKTYTPASNYFGVDSIRYVANDGSLDSVPSTVVITVAPVFPARKAVAFRFQGYNRSETLTNFPALVIFNKNDANFAYSDFATTNGADLRFMDSAYHAVPHEIEKWDTNGSSYVWVRVPLLSSSNDYVWAYWGNASDVTAPAYTTNGATWPAEYAGVWHLNAPSSPGLYADSTPGCNSGLAVGVSGVAGMIGGAAGFNHTNSVSIPSNVFFNVINKVTISLWQYGDVTQPEFNFIYEGHRSGTNYSNTLAAQIPWANGGTTNVYFYGGYPSAGMIVTAVSTNEYKNRWNHWTFVKDAAASSMRLYLNGVLRSTSVDTALIDGIDAFRLGSKSDGRYGYHGLIDEFRIASVGQSSNWIWACYMNQASNAAFCGSLPMGGGVAPHRLTVLLDAGGSVSSLTDGWYENGAPAKVVVVATNYYHWGSWSGDVPVGVTNCNPLTLTMDQDRVIVAHFAADLTCGHLTPKWWLAQKLGVVCDFETSELRDDDGDGLLNWQEYVTGTDPIRARSALAVASSRVIGGGAFVLSWESVSGRLYSVMRCTNLLSGEFTGVISNMPALPPMNVYTDSVNTGVSGFYKIIVH